MICLMLIVGRRRADLGLGTAPFAFGGGTAADSAATVHAALDAGVRLVDTALAYTRAGAQSYAEQVIATALRGVGAAAELRREGKIAAIGLSNVTVAQLDEALTAAPAGAVAAVQNRLSYADPSDLPTATACAQRGIAYIAHSTLARPPQAPALQAALAVAGRHGASVQRVLLAWLRSRAPGVVPLVGAGRPASIRDSSVPLELTEQELANLSRLSDGEYSRPYDG
jgi:aryl-alcohol dehydrogenase-like predicted oxidoreductase